MGVTSRKRETPRIAVLCGGPGAEREVSLQSGEAVLNGLLQAGHDAYLTDVSGQPEEIEALDCDLAFLALHGEFGEDGAVQTLLQRRGLPHTGSSAATCALTINKQETKSRLAASGLPVARGVVTRAAAGNAEKLERRDLALPVVVKPLRRGSSVGTTIVERAEELDAAVRAALRFDTDALIERFVRGRELTVGMLCSGMLPLVELVTPRRFYDYEAKYRSASTRYLCPAPLEDDSAREIQRIAASAFELLRVRHLGRVDLLLEAGGGPVLLEVNTTPGFTSHSLLPLAAAAAGISLPEMCSRIAMSAWRDHLARGERRPEKLKRTGRCAASQ